MERGGRQGRGEKPGKKPKYPFHLEKKGRGLQDGPTISRRRFLQWGLGGLAAAGGALFTGWKFTEFLTDSSSLERQKAIRQQIKEFEETNPEITRETLQTLVNLELQLYEATFKRKPAPTRLGVATNDDLKNEGLREKEVPEGQAGAFILRGISAKDNIQTMIPIFIFLGKPENTDVQVKRISVFKGLIAHELIHTQTLPRIEKGTITIGESVFTVEGYARGFKYVDKTGEEYGHFFNEINTQLLTEYFLDPTGQDTLFHAMSQSPVYKRSITPTYTEGARILRELYLVLGISMEAVETFHFNAQPKEFLELIDQLIEKRRIRLNQKASQTLINLVSKGQSVIEGLASLHELLIKIK